VIALTAHAIKGDVKKYMNLGCDDYLSKPIDKERFREKIVRIVHLRSMLWQINWQHSNLEKNSRRLKPNYIPPQRCLTIRPLRRL
jgi:response regulator of citrate/malate metabolism